MDGILIINKDKGMTSHDVVARLRRILHEKKIGHSGTLDPQASGVLLVMVGKACKLLPFLSDTDKEYESQLRLGIKTISDDIWGEVIEEKEIRPISDFAKICSSFLGEIEQVPPMISSIKINGKKLYEYARAHQSVEIPPRKVKIYDIRILDETNLRFRVACSSGTYVRALCRDMAALSDNLGCMSELIRTKVGRFSIADSHTLKEVEDGNYQLLPFDALLDHIPIVSYQKLEDIYNGKSVHIPNCSEKGRIRIQDQKRTIAIYQYSHGDVYRCVRGIW